VRSGAGPMAAGAEQEATVTGRETQESLAPAPALAAALAEGGAAADALMARYCAGDAAAFEALYARYRGPVYRFFRRQMPAADADECHQEVWLKVINARHAYAAAGAFRPWLFTIAHHALTDRHRRQLKHDARDPNAEPDECPAPDADPAGSTERARTAAALYQAIGALPVAQREALLLRESVGLSTAEIARITGTSEEGVKSRLRYAMQKLRTALARP
jgi:RNA polymerase sigma factor (sigma-70 family)